MDTSNNLASDEKIFVPRHDFQYYVALIAGPVFVALSIWLMNRLDGEKPMLYACAAFSGFATIVTQVHAVRRIRFGSDIVVDRYLLPPRRCDHADVVDVGLTAIKTLRGKIMLFGMTNVDELHSLLDESRRRGKLSERQVEGAFAAAEAVSYAAASRAIVPSIVAALVLIWISPFQLRFDSRMTFFFYWAPTYLLTYFIARRLLLRKSG